MPAINSVAGQLVGIPVGQVYTAGPGIKIDNVNKVVSVDITWTDVSSEITASAAVTGGAWKFYYSKALRMIAIIGEAHVQDSGAVYTLPAKYRPINNFVLSSPTGVAFIDYSASTGVFAARPGTNTYFSMQTTMPCTGE